VNRCSQAFFERGYFVVPAFYSAAEVKVLAALIEPILKQWQSTLPPDFKGVNMHSLSHSAYFSSTEARVNFFEHLISPALVETLDSCFGKDLYFHNTQLFFNPEDIAQRPYWHRDLQFSSISDFEQSQEQSQLLSLHLRIPLLPEAGIELIPGSHARWDTERESRVRFETSGHRHFEMLPDSELIQLAPGDLLVFDGQMIHRRHYAGNSARKALDICVGKPHALLKSFLDPANLPTQAELRALSQPQWFERAWEFWTSSDSTERLSIFEPGFQPLD